MARVIMILLFLGLTAQEHAVYAGDKLTGSMIGSSSSNSSHIVQMAFDGKRDTYYSSARASRGWIGLDLGRPHVIDRVGWATATGSSGAKYAQLGVFEGANKADFSDAMPLYLIPTATATNGIKYQDVVVSRAFRYVRYMGTANSHCQIAEVEFWGYAGEGSDERFYQITNLPTVVIHTADDGDPTTAREEHESMVSIISQGGTHLLQDTAMTRVRGNASADFPKKPYRIKFDEKHRVLGSPAKAKKWTLINNYGDKTLMRNMLAFELSRRIGMAYTPFCQPVDVILNGEYQGCYQLCDQIDIRKNRVDITEMDVTCTSGDKLTGGYLIEVDAYYYKEAKNFVTKRNVPVSVKYPDSDEILSSQFNYIQGHFKAFEDALYDTKNWRDDEVGYRHYIDMPSMMRHFLVGEFSGNTDTYWSVYLYKDRLDPRFYFGPVWDFDIAFENDNRTYPICNLNDYVYRTRGSSAGNFSSVVSRIMVTDTRSAGELEQMWAYARRHQGYDEASLMTYIDSVAQELDESQRLNFVRWPILMQYVHQNPVLAGTYEGEVANLCRYLSQRIRWMDKKLNFDPTAPDPDGIDDAMASDRIEIRRLGGRLYIAGVQAGTPYIIYDMRGVQVASGTTGVIGPTIGAGIYVLRIDGRTVKVKL